MSDAYASPESVNSFHTNSDLDSGDLAGHHTLGYGPNQAAPGLSVNRRLSSLEDYNTTDERPLNEFTAASIANIANNAITVHGAWTALAGTPGMSGAGTYFSAYNGAGVWTVSVAGIYLVEFAVTWAANAAGVRKCILQRNGVEFTRAGMQGTAAIETNQVVTPIKLAVGDTLGTYVYQNSGAALALAENTTPARMKIVRLV